MGINNSNLPPIPDGFQLKDDSTSSGQNGLPPIPDGFQLKGVDNSQPNGKPFYDSLGANMTPGMKQDHPVLAGIEQTAQDVGTVAEKAANGLTLGGLDYGLGKAGIQPPNFDNTAPENKSGLNLIGDAANTAAGGKTLGVIGSKVVAPAVKAVAKAVPEGLKQSSYGLMQSIVNQLPKEFKYGANAGRAMVKEGFSGDASDIKEQADKRIGEIGSQGDALASASNKFVDNSNAMKIIDDKISELQNKSPRTSASTISKLTDAKKDLLRVQEGSDENGNNIITNPGTDVSNMTPKETLDLKRDFDDQTAWKGTAADDTVFNKTMQQARTQLKDNLNDAVPGMKDWNQRYADLRAAQQAAGRTATRDQAGVGMSNMINNFVRGSIGMSTFGAMITGHGELAGEILAGGIGKEIVTNPYLKSKLAQGLYGLSEADKMAIFKAVPWAKKAMDNFRQQPSPSAVAEPVEAELMGGKRLPPPNKIGLNRALPSEANRGTGPTINQSGYTPPGLPNNAVGRTGVNPNVSMGALPDPGNTPINQPGYVPKGLPEPFLGRSGVDRPYENTGLPSPRTAGQSSGPVINQDTSYVKPPADRSYPQTDFGHQIKFQMQQKENVPLHPAEAGRAELAKIYPPAVKGNPNLKPGDLDDFNNMKDWELSQNPGGWKSHGPQMDLSFTKSPTGHSEAFKKVSNNSEKAGFDLLRRASNGEEMTNGDKLKIQMMLHDFRKNIKPKMG